MHLSYVVSYLPLYTLVVGPEGTSVGYLRPETAQGLFVNFRYGLGQGTVYTYYSAYVYDIHTVCVCFTCYVMCMYVYAICVLV